MVRLIKYFVRYIILHEYLQEFKACISIRQFHFFTIAAEANELSTSKFAFILLTNVSYLGLYIGGGVAP